MVVRAVWMLAVATAVLAVARPSDAAKVPKVGLTVTVTGSGKVTSAPAGIACRPKCKALFTRGITAALRAAPAKGWKFARWTGACTGAATRCNVKLTTAKKAGAIFTKIPPPPAGFTPQVLAGTWQGTWRNTRFGSTGPASVAVTIMDANSFSFSLTIGGNVFGCPPAPPVAAVITKGDGVNRWNANGFSLQITGPQGGSINVTYDFKAQTLNGNGRPGCRPTVTWALQGTFSGNTYNGTMTVTLEDGSTAQSVITLTRS